MNNLRKLYQCNTQRAEGFSFNFALCIFHQNEENEKKKNCSSSKSYCFPLSIPSLTTFHYYAILYFLKALLCMRFRRFNCAQTQYYLVRTHKHQRPKVNCFALFFSLRCFPFLFQFFHIFLFFFFFDFPKMKQHFVARVSKNNMHTNTYIEFVQTSDTQTAIRSLYTVFSIFITQMEKDIRMIFATGAV